MFTANSMNCLNEAIGLALPGNGTIVATHANRKQLFKEAAALIVKNAINIIEEGDESVLPRSIATRAGFPQCNDTGYCYGRFYQYRASFAGNCTRGRGGFHNGRY